MIQFKEFLVYSEEFITHLIFQQYSDHTIKLYKKLIDNLKLYNGEPNINRAIIALSFSPATYNHYASLVNTMSHFIGKRKEIAEIRKIIHVETKKSFKAVPSQEEMILKLLRLKGVCSDWIGYRNYALVLFLYATGCRIHEALAFRASFFLSKNTLIIRVDTLPTAKAGGFCYHRD